MSQGLTTPTPAPPHKGEGKAGAALCMPSPLRGGERLALRLVG